MRLLNPQLSSHTDFDVLIAVSLWFFCITARAEVLSDPDSNAVNEQPARGKSALKAHDNPEAVTKWQQTGTDDGKQSRGTESIHDLSLR